MRAVVLVHQQYVLLIYSLHTTPTGLAPRKWGNLDAVHLLHRA